MKRFPFTTDELRELEPPELRELCRVVWALLEYCGGTERATFDADELGLDPEEDDD